MTEEQQKIEDKQNEYDRRTTEKREQSRRMDRRTTGKKGSTRESGKKLKKR